MNEMRMVMEKGYMISDASKMLEVENHVLRYWEEELELPIPRNELGHRYYRDSEIRLLRSVKDLKEQGFQLKAIKKLLPDLERVENMDPKILYQLREELNGQVMREALEHAKGSVTSIEHARDRYEKRQKTWQEKSYELEQSKEKSAGVQTKYGQSQAASLERLRQFETMMRQMIRSSMEEVSQESENRICEEVTVRLQKEMNYLLMQKEELQERQLYLLKEILQQVKGEEASGDHKAEQEDSRPEDTPVTGDATEAAREVAAAQEEAGEVTEFGRKNRRKARKKSKRKKLFAKSLPSC